jgi:hypothetical protein
MRTTRLSQLRKNLFETPYAHALLAFNDAESTKPVGLALYFFNYSTWTGRPGLYVRLRPSVSHLFCFIEY